MLDPSTKGSPGSQIPFPFVSVNFSESHTPFPDHPVDPGTLKSSHRSRIAIGLTHSTEQSPVQETSANTGAGRKANKKARPAYRVIDSSPSARPRSSFASAPRNPR